MPAIATEGRALFDAVVAQGLAGMMARQRQGPYLPGRAQPAVAVHPGRRRRRVPTAGAEPVPRPTSRRRSSR